MYYHHIHLKLRFQGAQVHINKRNYYTLLLSLLLDQVYFAAVGICLRFSVSMTQNRLLKGRKRGIPGHFHTQANVTHIQLIFLCLALSLAVTPSAPPPFLITQK